MHFIGLGEGHRRGIGDDIAVYSHGKHTELAFEYHQARRILRTLNLGEIRQIGLKRTSDPMLTVKSTCPPGYAISVGTRALATCGFSLESEWAIRWAFKKTSKKNEAGSVRLRRVRYGCIKGEEDRTRRHRGHYRTAVHLWERCEWMIFGLGQQSGWRRDQSYPLEKRWMSRASSSKHVIRQNPNSPRLTAQFNSPPTHPLVSRLCLSGHESPNYDQAPPRRHRCSIHSNSSFCQGKTT